MKAFKGFHRRRGQGASRLDKRGRACQRTEVCLQFGGVLIKEGRFIEFAPRGKERKKGWQVVRSGNTKPGGSKLYKRNDPRAKRDVSHGCRKKKTLA